MMSRRVTGLNGKVDSDVARFALTRDHSASRTGVSPVLMGRQQNLFRKVEYWRDVRAILDRSCVGCHSRKLGAGHELPGNLDYDPANPSARRYGWMCDDNRPVLSVTYPRPGANDVLSRILVGMHDYASGLDPTSFHRSLIQRQQDASTAVL